MNRRQPIYWMIACGLVLIAALTAIPHFISARAILESSVGLFVPADRLEVAHASPTEVKPSFDAASWYEAHGESKDSHGVLVETLDGSRVLASLNADLTFNPASLIKLSTSLVALKKLGADFHFQTRVLIEGGADSKGAAAARIYLSGNDPTFGDAGANLIAKELHARGVERLSEVVVSPEFCFNFSNNAEESAGRLAKVLKLGSPKTSVADGAGGQLLLVVNSNPLSDILLYMNARSSNFIAERVGAMVGGPEGVKQFLVSELHLPPDQVTVERTSGREHNRMTPRGLLMTIRALVEEARRQNLDPTDIMPVASDDSGTLRRRFEGTGLEGAVVGKSGTLTQEVDGGMASLAGIVYTEDQGVIVFAILDQGNQIAGNRLLEDQLLTDVINSQARPRVVASPTPRKLLPSTGLHVERE